MPRRISTIITQHNQYRILLITLIVFLIISPLTPATVLGFILYTLSFLSIMLGVAQNIKSQPFATITLLILGACSIILSFFQNIIPMLILENISTFLFFFYAIILFGRNIYLERTYVIESIYGAICIYLLIGIAYATLYMILSNFSISALQFTQNGAAVHSRIDFYYFSFVTLTTVGFGDIVANSNLAKGIVMLEASTGLFYLSILVASLSQIIKPTKDNS